MRRTIKAAAELDEVHLLVDLRPLRLQAVAVEPELLGRLRGVVHQLLLHRVLPRHPRHGLRVPKGAHQLQLISAAKAECESKPSPSRRAGLRRTRPSPCGPRTNQYHVPQKLTAFNFSIQTVR